MLHELPSAVTFLPAGPMPMQLAAVAAELTGGDVMHPSVEGIGATFGGVQLDLSVTEAVPAATSWAPDLIVSDMFNSLGAYLSAVLTVPWHQFSMTVGLQGAWITAGTGEEWGKAAFFDDNLT